MISPEMSLLKGRISDFMRFLAEHSLDSDYLLITDQLYTSWVHTQPQIHKLETNRVRANIRCSSQSKTEPGLMLVMGCVFSGSTGGTERRDLCVLLTFCSNINRYDIVQKSLALPLNVYSEVHRGVMFTTVTSQQQGSKFKQKHMVNANIRYSSYKINSQPQQIFLFSREGKSLL